MISKSFSIAMLTVSILTIISFHSCKKDKQAEGIDKQMFDMALETSGFTWYKNSDALLNKSAGSGHSEPYLKTRYNTTAANMLDSVGKVHTGSVFPDGAFIVKELYKDDQSIGRYAILYKKSGDANADANGWVWGYINEDGSVAEPAANKGSSCRSCHLQADNIDYMLMNKYFP